jgi:hypothetical protein
MKTYVKRVITITYAVEDIKFKTDAEINAFHKALGRMVAYGTSSDEPRNIEYVNMSIDRDREITGAYFPPWKRGETYEDNRAQYKLEASFDEFKTGRAFVIGAIPRDGGVRYSFHS